MKALAAIGLVVGAALLAPGVSQAGATTCGAAVMRDWADGGIDGRYAPHCYAEALDALPEDVRAYSTAADDIAQALRARVRETTRDRTAARREAPPSAGAAFGLPLPLVSGGAIAFLLCLAGVGAFLVRRLRRGRFTHRGSAIGHV